MAIAANPVKNPMKPLPSLDVLKTFLVVAQKLNFTRAADALNITQGAVSRQIAGLEAHLGYALFTRQARGLALTHQGALLVAPLQQAFAQIGDALAKGGAQSGILRVKCPTCAMRWVLPRVIRLQNERPDLVVEVTASVSHGVEFGAEQFDAAIVFGAAPSLKGVTAHHLFDEVLTPVCAPELWKPGKASRRPPTTSRAKPCCIPRATAATGCCGSARTATRVCRQRKRNILTHSIWRFPRRCKASA